MTTEEYQPFVAELKNIDAFKVLENTRPIVQPDPIKRALAATELERRRQARAPATINDPRFGRLVLVSVIGILAVAAYLVFY